MCSGCGCFFKNICIRITYTILIAAIFVVPLTMAIDTYISVRPFTTNFIENAKPITVSPIQVLNYNTNATIKSYTIPLTLQGGYYVNITQIPMVQCLVHQKHNNSFAIYMLTDQANVTVNEVVNNQIKEVRKLVSCIDSYYFDDKHAIPLTFNLSGGLGMAGIAAVVLAIVLMWIFCVDWCLCCCCSKQRSNSSIVAVGTYV